MLCEGKIRSGGGERRSGCTSQRGEATWRWLRRSCGMAPIPRPQPKEARARSFWRLRMATKRP
eukprot:5750791-Prymnesium_polylepis.1